MEAKSRRKIFWLSILAVIFATSCGIVIYFLIAGKSQVRQLPKVVLIGIDGAGWNLIEPLLVKKALPNFQALMNEGAYGSLGTLQPALSSVIWTSIATGKSSAKHGIEGWVEKDEEGLDVPYRQSQRKVKAFWNILSETGRTVGVVNWFITLPPEEVNGFMVSEEFRHLGYHNFSKVRVTYPADLIKILKFARSKNFKKILAEEKIPDYRQTTPPSKILPFFPRFISQDKTVELASLFLYEHFPVDVFATYFRLIDVTGHFAWEQIDARLLEKGRSEESRGGVSRETRKELDEAFSRVLEPLYSYADRILGRFFELAGPETTFIIVSDHCFEFINGKYNHSGTAEAPDGIILMKGPNIKENFKLRGAHVYDIVPTLLYLLNLPVAKDMDGKVLLDAIEVGFIKKNPLKWTRSYEGPSQKKRVLRNKELDQKLLEELRALGYIN